jgi:hypothetical protein
MKIVVQVLAVEERLSVVRDLTARCWLAARCEAADSRQDLLVVRFGRLRCVPRARLEGTLICAEQPPVRQPNTPAKSFSRQFELQFQSSLETRSRPQHARSSDEVPTTRATRLDVISGTRHSDFRVAQEHPRNDDALAPVVLPLRSPSSRPGVRAC